MALAIALRFSAGRFHATPWGRHVNEGVPEWTSSPWRLLRALVAVWRRKLHEDPLADDHMEALLRKIAAPPYYRLPKASIGHTRHYMPWYKKGPADRTLVFDTFVAVDPEDPLLFIWPDVELTDKEKEALGLVLSRMTYFGRAESWCEARIAPESGIEEADCFPASGRASEGTEPVRLLCANEETAFETRHSKHPFEPKWHLCMETLDIREARWSDPPGSRWVKYRRPKNCFAVTLKGKAVKKRRPVTVARFALDGTVLPPVRETVKLADYARQRLQGIYGKQNGGASSPLLSGKTAGGVPLEGHPHSFYLPTDEDGDGRIDHLTVYASGNEELGEGFGDGELKALGSFRKLHQGDGKPELNLLLTGLGREDDFIGLSLFGPSLRWRSIAPFVPTRHHRKGRGLYREWLHQELALELSRRGKPTPRHVEPVERLSLGSRGIRWVEFRRERIGGGGNKGTRLGYGFEIEFDEPVCGPLSLGYGAHFGLGLFLASEQ